LSVCHELLFGRQAVAQPVGQTPRHVLPLGQPRGIGAGVAEIHEHHGLPVAVQALSLKLFGIVVGLVRPVFGVGDLVLAHPEFQRFDPDELHTEVGNGPVVAGPGIGDRITDHRDPSLSGFGFSVLLFVCGQEF
jgi:hypothetical protein